MQDTDDTVPHVIMAPRSIYFSFGVDVHERYPLEIPKERLDAMSPIKRKFYKGDPKRLTLTADQREGRKWRPLPAFFMAGHLTVSKPLADLLLRFDIGPARLRPVDLTAPKDADRGLDYVSLSFYPVTPTHPVLVDHCRSLAPQQPGDRQHFIELTVEPGDIVLSATPQNTADIWYDPVLYSVYFASGPLSRALIDAGMAEDLWLVPCALT